MCARSATVTRVVCWVGLWIACKILVRSKKRCGWSIRSRGEVADGLECHADRGTQFISEQLWEMCRNLGIAQSVGRTGAF